MSPTGEISPRNRTKATNTITITSMIVSTKHPTTRNPASETSLSSLYLNHHSGYEVRGVCVDFLLYPKKLLSSRAPPHEHSGIDAGSSVAPVDF